MDEERTIIQTEASRDFSRARTRAFWEEIWSLLSKKPKELLDFEDVKRHLHLRSERPLGLQNIPVHKIVGSVGRYQDFTRSFLPKRSVNRDRWKRINALARGQAGFPPIEVYKVDDAYFVIDGNHRVSVARQLNMPTIEAYVRELHTNVAINEKLTPQELFEKGAYADFLSRTRLNVLRPDNNIWLSEPSLYPNILRHIDEHRYFMGIDQQHSISHDEAVKSWYDNIYQPMTQAIREHQVLDLFPGRTEADMYVWLMNHQEAMRNNYGGEWMSAEDTVRTFKDTV